jgi:hypothetical protein
LKKTLTLIAIALLLTTLSLTLTPQNVSSKTQDIKVLSYSYYIDNLGFLDVVGEIQNTGTSTIKEVVLTMTAYGADGSYQGNSTKRAWVSYMVPQQKAPFLLDIEAPQGGSDWYTVGVSKIDISVTVANDDSSYLYPDLAITVNSASASTSDDDKGTYWISGVVRNTGSQTASKLAVAAIFYNSSGSVIAVGHTDYLTPESLSPSGTVSFKVGAYDTNQTAEPASRKITNYSLFVQAVTPLIEGTAPASTAQATGSTQTGAPSQQNDSTDGSANQNLLYILIIAGVAVAVIAALLVSRRGHPSKEAEV